jgi:hypothetical protein
VFVKVKFDFFDGNSASADQLCDGVTPGSKQGHRMPAFSVSEVLNFIFIRKSKPSFFLFDGEKRVLIVNFISSPLLARSSLWMTGRLAVDSGTPPVSSSKNKQNRTVARPAREDPALAHH